MGVVGETALAAKIKAALAMDARVGAGKITVSAGGDTVTLQGVVHTANERTLAETVAREQGATRVVNELRVEDRTAPGPSYIPESFPGVTTSEGGPMINREALEERIRQALENDDRVNERLVELIFQGDTVVLDGRQDTVQAQEAAADIVRAVPGVGAVVNNLEVRPSV